MAGDHHHPPGPLRLIRKLSATGLGALQNRAELLAVEWQEERSRLAELLVWTVGLLFLGIMGAILLTAILIFLFPAELRLYAAAGFALLYLAGAAVAWFNLRSLLRQEPFSETIGQVKKDRLWLDSFE
jgi:uncharacterized membrane protein YqjE